MCYRGEVPHIARVGRKSLRARLALAVVYALLMLGAVSTVVPFLLMATTGLKGATDQNQPNIVPAYLTAKDIGKRTEPESLLGKYLDDKYSGNADAMASMAGGPADHVEEARAWLLRLPPDQWTAGFRTAPNQVTGRLSMAYQSWLRKRYGSIDKLNRAYIEESPAFQAVSPPQERLHVRGWKPMPGPKWREWLEFKATLPAEFRIPLLYRPVWQEFCRSKYQNDFKLVPARLSQGAKDFGELEIPAAGSEWTEFLRTRWPEGLPDLESKFRAFAPRASGFPRGAFDEQTVRENASAIRSEFAGRNYRYVLDFILLHGQAVGNTALLCALAIGVQLTVNPLAAYALSRFPGRRSSRVLLALLATMAFPAEIALIPSFLLLKDLGLLNTFLALVLPGAASGYMIYLLKGFFDSLPGELFESGQLDGATEGRMLWKIALPLSRPVLGYLALLAFMGAYSSFLFAFLVCQDRSKWTLMVFLYQLQLSAPRATVMAALTLAALPTLVVFLLAQRVIMRGIVLPGER